MIFGKRKRLKTGKYTGAVVFWDGRHYPANGNGFYTEQGLTWNVDQECYYWAQPEDPLHNDTHGKRTVDIEVE